MSNCQDLINEAFNQCNYGKLNPGDPQWVDLDKDGLRGEESCLQQLVRVIRMRHQNKKTANLLFSGFRGSGKSTILKDLEKTLNSEGHKVIYIDAVAFLNMGMPIETYEILLTIAGELDRAITWSGKKAGMFWERIHRFLTQEVTLKEVTVKIPEIAEFQTEISKNLDFRKGLSSLLERRQQNAGMIKQCRDFFDEIISQRRKDGKEEGLVVILDSLEHLGGREFETIQDSLNRVFDLHADDLLLPFHTIYTVPPWLRYTCSWNTIKGKFDDYVMLPMVKVTDRQTGQPAKGIEALIRMIDKRVHLEALFGDDNQHFLKEMVRLSGGYPRDLLRLMQGILGKMFSNQDKCPLAEEKISNYLESELVHLAEDYSASLFIDDMDKLIQVVETNDIPEREIPAKRLAELLDHHFIICYRNRETWYDVHPILREKSDRYKRLAQHLKERNEKRQAE